MKIIARLKGGLGNQLFSYAAARSISYQINADLIIDEVTGFIRDKAYKRRYALDIFDLPIKHANFFERLQPFERERRALRIFLNKYYHFNRWGYIYDGNCKDINTLDIKKYEGIVYFDGIWPGINLIPSIESMLRKDLKFKNIQDLVSKEYELIKNANSVFLHIRSYEESETHQTLDVQYYLNSMTYIRSVLEAPIFFVFSDNPSYAKKIIGSMADVIFIEHENMDQTRKDLWLMSQCKHGIIANSTLSWWGAWMIDERKKICIAPHYQKYGVTEWSLGDNLGDFFTLI